MFESRNQLKATTVKSSDSLKGKNFYMYFCLNFPVISIAFDYYLFQAKTRVKLQFLDKLAKFWELQVCGLLDKYLKL